MELNALSNREDFPILKRRMRGDKQLVYLNNASTSQKPEQVLNSMMDHYRHHNSEVHVGIPDTLSKEASEALMNARNSVAKLIHASPDEIVFTRNATEAINLVAFAWGRHNLHQGDTVLVSVAEHDSNLVPWQQVAEAQGIELNFVGLNENQEIDLENLKVCCCCCLAVIALTATALNDGCCSLPSSLL